MMGQSLRLGLLGGGEIPPAPLLTDKTIKGYGRVGKGRTC